MGYINGSEFVRYFRKQNGGCFHSRLPFSETNFALNFKIFDALDLALASQRSLSTFCRICCRKKRFFCRKGVAFKLSFRHESAIWEERHEDEDSGFSGRFKLLKSPINAQSVT